MPKLDPKYEKALAAISEVNADTSVSRETTVERLGMLREEIDTMITAIEEEEGAEYEDDSEDLADSDLD